MQFWHVFIEYNRGAPGVPFHSLLLTPECRVKCVIDMGEAREGVAAAGMRSVALDHLLRPSGRFAHGEEHGNKGATLANQAQRRGDTNMCAGANSKHLICPTLQTPSPIPGGSKLWTPGHRFSPVLTGFLIGCRACGRALCMQAERLRRQRQTALRLDLYLGVCLRPVCSSSPAGCVILLLLPFLLHLPPSPPAAAPKLKQLKNQAVSEGGKLSLKCEATGNPAPSYKWYKDGGELKRSKEIKIKSNK